MTECIIATGYLAPNGYGRATLDGKQQLAHRVAWQKAHGPIPEGMEIMHLCDNPSCVNVEHLKPGTHTENMADMARKGRHRPWSDFQTHCKHGHPFDEENTEWGTRNGLRVRSCRICRRASALRRYYRMKEISDAQR